MAGPLPSCILIRHGIAEERGDAWPGRRQTAAERGRESSAFAEVGARPGAASTSGSSVVLTSPLVRAQADGGYRRRRRSIRGRRCHYRVARAPGEATRRGRLADLEKHGAQEPHRAGRTRAG